MFKLIPFMHQTAKSMSQGDVRELIEMLVNNVNDPNNLLIPLDDNKYKVINVDDILYIHHPKKNIFTIILAEGNNNIPYRNQAFDIMNYVSKTNANFRFLDIAVLVNLQHIEKYNSYLRKVYFKNGSNLDITGMAMNSIIIKHFGKCLDMHVKGIQDEYLPYSERRRVTYN